MRKPQSNRSGTAESSKRTVQAPVPYSVEAETLYRWHPQYWKKTQALSSTPIIITMRAPDGSGHPSATAKKKYTKADHEG